MTTATKARRKLTASAKAAIRRGQVKRRDRERREKLEGIPITVAGMFDGIKAARTLLEACGDNLDTAVALITTLHDEKTETN